MTTPSSGFCRAGLLVLAVLTLGAPVLAEDAITREAIAIYRQFAPQANDWMRTAADGEFTWGGPDMARTELQMYCVTGDAAHVVRVIEWAELLMANRSDRRGIPDDFRGEIVKGWISNSYSFGLNYALGSAAAMQCSPISLAIYYVHADPVLRAEYGDRALALLRDVADVMDQFERDYREGPQPGEGHYCNLYSDLTWAQPDEPFNLQSFFGSTMLNLYLITGEEKYRERAGKIARNFQRHLRPVEDRVVWPYSVFRLRYDPEAVEDFSHGGVNAYFAFECVRAGVVFDASDMTRMANLLKFLYRGASVGYADLLNGERVEPNAAASRRWSVLGAYDAQVRENELARLRHVRTELKPQPIASMASSLAYSGLPPQTYEPLRVAVPPPHPAQPDPAIVLVAGSGDAERLRSLIADGADLAQSGVDGQTALHRAAMAGALDAMRLLLDAGADVNAVDRRGYNVLLAAAAAGQVDAVDLLLRHGVDVNATDKFGRSALHLAGNYGRLEVARRLLAAGADFTGNPVAGSPIHGAAAAGAVELVALLLDAGEDINRLDARYKAPPLYLAATYDRREVVAFLLERGADLSIRMKHNRTPLDIAVENGHVEVARLLVEHGADPLADDRLGIPLPRRAEIDGRPELAALLRSYETVPATP